jgi:isopentenyl phosphate kinase
VSDRCLVLKIGGSLVSDKKGNRHIDHDLVAAYSAMVADLVALAPGRVVLVAGGGAFGHGAVRGLDPDDPFAALDLTEATFQVKWAWAKALRAVGVRAMPLQLAAVTTLDDGEGRVQGEVLCRLLRHGMLPVLSGDCLLNEHGVLEVFGSDRVPSLVLDAVSDRVRIVTLTDVPGVLLDGPDGDRVLPYIDPDDPSEAFAATWDNSAWDTSGAMAGKLHELIAFARRGAECFITRGNPAEGSLRFLLDPAEQWPAGIRHTRIATKEAL